MVLETDHLLLKGKKKDRKGEKQTNYNKGKFRSSVKIISRLPSW